MTNRDDLELRPPEHPANDEVLDAEARLVLSELVRDHAASLAKLLARREALARARALAPSSLPGFLGPTRCVRDSDWRVAPLPSSLLRRVVELNGPPERRRLLHGLRSGADVFMADLEDATAPRWARIVEGHRNLRDAASRTLTDSGRDGRTLALDGPLATLMVRPRGLHLDEAHVLVGGRAAPAALVDVGLFARHVARAQLARGEPPCLYLPKLESHREARWWHEVLSSLEARFSLGADAIKVTVLVETLPAAFEMDEILFELRGRALGLNCGRWDYVFSAIKTRRDDPQACFPDRDALGMTQPFLRDYAQT